jgi:uncharacterized protein (DUF1697 family)
MPTYVSLLRGINVGGRNQIAMADLRALYSACGHRDVTTYVQSGNVVSTTAQRQAVSVARRIERAIADTLGLDVVVLIRTPDELVEVLTGNPFAARESDPTKLHVTFLRDDPGTVAVSPEDARRFAPDEYVVVGREVYAYCPNGYGTTKINNTFFEKRLGVPATTRNWKTVAALVDRSRVGGTALGSP